MTTAISRRFTEHAPIGKRIVNLARDHAAAVEGRPLFSWRTSTEDPKPLKPGNYQRKIGSHVGKGAWSGFPIYCLTLPERTTCPRSCGHWLDCYGNKMNWAKRHAPGERLEFALRAQIAALAAKHPDGFVVRLHILGDFYSVEYVEMWAALMARYPMLRVFGYTARDPNEAIGEALGLIEHRHRWRWAVRYSNGDPDVVWAHARTVSIDTAEDCPPDAIVCPAQTDKTDCCGTCALCWTTHLAIAFLRH